MTAKSSEAAALATALAALANGLAPDGSQMGPVIEAIARLHGAGNAAAVAARASAAAGYLTPRPAQVTVGGYFSSGKSTLINMLIGTPLLPADDFPETGVPCLLQSGSVNRVLVQTGDGMREIPFSTESISAYVTLTGNDGTFRDEIRAVRDVRITLANGAVPAGATWVDSPGISDGMDDDERRRELPAKLAREGDLLVWVANSRQELSLTEQEFIAAHLEEAGPASVVFVVNAFLTADTAQEWQAFTDRKAYVGRITQHVDTGDVPLRIVLASARAGAVDRDRFGAPEARALLAAHSAGDSPRVIATRVFRAMAELSQVTVTLDELVAAEELACAEAAAAVASAQAERVREHAEFLRAVRREVAEVFSENEDLGGDAAWEAIPGSSESLGSPSYYASRFESELEDRIGKLTDELERAIDRCAGQHGHSYIYSDGIAEIAQLLEPEDVYISGASGGSKAGGAVAGAAIGALGGPIGMVIGGLIGSALSGSAGASRQREEIGRQLRSAGRSATARILSARDDVAGIAERHCEQDGGPPTAPSQDKLEATRKVRELFSTDILGALSALLSSAQHAVDD